MNFLVEDDENSDFGLGRKILGSILDADVYFGREYNGLAGKDLSEKIASCNSGQGGLMYLSVDPVLYTNNLLTQEIYDVLLRLYENNQMILMSKDTKVNVDTLAKLTNLESWFIQIIEPKPHRDIEEIKEWTEREKCKLNGYSAYCDHELRKKIKIKTEIMDQVRTNYNNMKTMSMIK